MKEEYKNRLEKYKNHLLNKRIISAIVIILTIITAIAALLRDSREIKIALDLIKEKNETDLNKAELRNLLNDLEELEKLSTKNQEIALEKVKKTIIKINSSDISKEIYTEEFIQIKEILMKQTWIIVNKLEILTKNSKMNLDAKTNNYKYKINLYANTLITICEYMAICNSVELETIKFTIDEI